MSTSAILSIVQKYPDILTDNADYVDELISLVQAQLVARCRLEEWPEADSPGDSVGGDNPTADISGIADNVLLLRIDGSAQEEVELTLANCTTETLTAAELQTAIRATLSSGMAGYRSFAGATAVWSSPNLIIRSPSYDQGTVKVESDDNHFLVAQNLKLGRTYGGTERQGYLRDTNLEQCAADLVSQAYRWYRMLPEIYDEVPDQAVQRVFRELSPAARDIINSHRNLRVY